ncbi:hypothetical protein UFOVP1518_48 [uncultured Caudovirales phage]|uniref:Uncharacterized protein n=1 Tax=uncultured Caudovirales phage TaxID=2100421 RepID=A0A6J5QC55_9CAUD|nr:hypothetical protein UFOVP475_61 [uncultured Caudovirales phage]CAB4169402.1 hypothetical protein UFOVP897_23 [uncultured Caudovirales phage]CAB4175881.1 hypothetical protein UFOVP984_61 [uncultured Caudovirales phage]CAB4181102.1 hypothetical protein UFOVP1072_12 [uncultured Caudovirales phage]CAB4191620.1 hypothetical protein UFOVP1211_60 [uncultured Caudovirales phage]
MRLKLPPAFIRDCLDSDCDVGSYQGGHLIAAPEQLATLRDRAEYYVHPDGPDAVGDGGALKRSAASLLAALSKTEWVLVVSDRYLKK